MTQQLQKKSVLIKEEKNQIFNIPSESRNQIRGIQFNSIFWNIDGLPLNNDTTIKSIQKKQCIESLYKYIDAQNKNSVAILSLIETNIKENEKEFNQLGRHVVNPSKQLKGDGIILQTNYQQVTQTLTKLNNNKLQILRANFAHQHIIIINIHMDHNNKKKNEQFSLMEQIINNVETDKTCLGTVIQGDFNTDFSIQKEWEHANKLMGNQLTRTISKATRGNKQLDDILISTKLKKNIIRKSIKAHVIDTQNKLSDHLPIQFQCQIKYQKILVNDVITNSDQLINKFNKQIKSISTSINQNTSLNENDPIDQNVIETKSQQILNKIKQIVKRKNNLKNKKITMTEWIRKSNKQTWSQLKLSLYGKKLKDNNDHQEIIKAIKENLRQRLYTIQQDLTKNRARDPKKYFKTLKNVLGLKNNKEILEPGKKMYKEDGNVTYNKQQHLRIVKKYFDEHYSQKTINLKNYPKKLTNQDAIILTENIDNALVSTNKACSSDGVKGSAIEIPKLIGKNRTVQGYKRILRTIHEIQTELSEKNKEQLDINQEVHPVYVKQTQQQIEVLKKTMLKIIKNPKQWPKLFEARQIYLPKTNERTPESCRPITILPTTVKLIESSILTQIQSNKDINKIDHRQTGFMSKRSTSFNLLRLLGRIKHLQNKDDKENNKPIIIFYDFKGAFDSPLHGKAWEALKKQNFPISIIKQIFWLYGLVNINQQKIGRGFLQGGITSPRLYIQYQQQALNEIEEKLNQLNIKLDYLAFADDLALIIKDINQAQTIIKTFVQTMDEYGLKINEKKTEYMIVNNKISTQTESTKITIQLIMDRLQVNYTLTKQFKYLGLWVENNGNVKSNQKAILDKMNKYQNVLKKISFISRNTTLITNTWTTFVRPQFQYGLTIIKEAKFKSTWNFFRKKYYQSLSKCLGLFRVTNGETLSQQLNMANVETIEKQYRLHILNQISKLTTQQKIFYNLVEIEQKWEQEINKPKIITIQTTQNHYEVTEAQHRHVTKQLLNYEGSLDVIQKIFKIKNFKQRRYYDEITKKRISAEQLIRRSKSESETQKIISIAQKWNIQNEFKRFLKDETQQEHIKQIMKSAYKDQVYGIPKQTLQHYLQIKQKQQYPYQIIKTVNLHLTSLKD